MTFFHSRHLARTRLLAAGALEGEDRAAAEQHLEGCTACRAEHDGVARVLQVLEGDPALRAAPPITLGALQARVAGRLQEREERREWGLRPALAAAAAVVVALLALGPTPPRDRPAPVSTAEDEGFSRLERTLAREETARFLTSAQDVLLTVSNPSRCPLKKGRVDVGEESRRSQSLLERRTLLVGTDSVPNAQPVLDDVERVLREVAALEPCTRKDALEEIHREVTDRRLLLRIDLMTQELAG